MMGLRQSKKLCLTVVLATLVPFLWVGCEVYQVGEALLKEARRVERIRATAARLGLDAEMLLDWNSWWAAEQARVEAHRQAVVAYYRQKYAPDPVELAEHARLVEETRQAQLPYNLAAAWGDRAPEDKPIDVVARFGPIPASLMSRLGGGSTLLTVPADPAEPEPPSVALLPTPSLAAEPGDPLPPTSPILVPGGPTLALAPPPGDPVAAKAAELGSDPVAIFNFMHDQVETELYFGVKKGPERTLAERSGNDLDQALLLARLLEAQGFEAQLSYGRMVLTPEQARDYTGTFDLSAAASLLAGAGVPLAFVPLEGHGTGVQIESAWVRATVPYTHYRGVPETGSLAQVVELAPAIKGYAIDRGEPLADLVSFDFTAYLDGQKPRSPVETYHDALLNSAQAATIGCEDLAHAVVTRELEPADHEVLPAELPTRRDAVLATFSPSAIPASLVHQATLTLRSPTGSVLWSHTAPTAELAARRLAVVYDPPLDPATHVWEQAMRARLLTGETIAKEASSPVPAGTPQLLEVTLSSPSRGPETLRHQLRVGGIYALTLSPGEPPSNEIAALWSKGGVETDDQLASRLYAASTEYLREVDRARNEIARLFGLATFKETTETMVGIDLRVSYFAGVPVAATRDFVIVDAPGLRFGLHHVLGDNSRRPEAGRLIGFETSVLEHETLEKVWSTNAYSAVKLLQKAAEVGIPRVTVTAANAATLIPTLNVDQDVKDRVQALINTGYEVVTMQEPYAGPVLEPLHAFIATTDTSGAYVINRTAGAARGGEGNNGGGTPGGADCCECTDTCVGVGSQVNVSMGQYTFTNVDLVLPAPGLPLTFGRTYHSQVLDPGAIGRGFTHTYEARVDAQPDGVLIYTNRLGMRFRFTDDGTGVFRSAEPDRFETIVADQAGGFVLTTPDGVKTGFGSGGEWRFTEDLSGHRLDAIYDPLGRVVSVTAPGGHALTLTYAADGGLASVTDTAGRQVLFSRNAAGELVSATDALGHATTYTYDATHRMRTKADPDGQTWQFAYDDLGRFVAATDPLGNTATVAYDLHRRRAVHTDRRGAATVYEMGEAGAATRRIDALGHPTEYTRNEKAQSVATTDARGLTSMVTFDAEGRVIGQVDAAGGVMTYEYGPHGRLTRMVDQSGAETRQAYNEKGELLATVDAQGAVTTYTVNAQGLLTAVTRPGGATTTIAYDSHGLPVSLTHPEGGTTALAYDLAGHPTGLTDANGATWTVATDAPGQITSVTDPMGAATTFTYDGRGNRTSVTDALGQVTSFEYDALGRLIATTDALGQVTRQVYDPEANLLATIDPQGFVTAMEYDLVGRMTRKVDATGGVMEMVTCWDMERPAVTIDAAGNATEVTFDALGRVTAQVDGLGRVSEMAYDPLGRVTTTKDGAGIPTHFGYDPVGRLTQVLDALGGLTGYGYDARGNRVSVADANANVTAFQYDAADRLVRETTAIGTVTEIGYDLAGNRVGNLDPRGQLRAFSYDGARRLVGVNHAGVVADAFEYDVLGRRVREVGPDIERHVDYDALGRPVRVEDLTAGKTLAYAFDPSGNRVRMELVEEGEVTGYLWDGAGRLVEMVDPEGGKYHFVYDAAGRRVRTLYPNGMTRVETWDEASQVTAMVYQDKKSEVLKAFTYTYDARGNRMTKGFEDGGVETYGYDALSRLTSAAYPSGKQQAFEYDAVGNRVALEERAAAGEPVETTVSTYNGFSQILSASGPSGVTTYSWDGNGNQTGKVGPEGVTSFVWDVRDRLVELTTPAGVVNRFGYDTTGLRVEMDDSAGHRRVVLDGIEEYAEVAVGSLAQVTRCDHDPSGVDALLGQVTGEGKHWFVTDALGSVYGLSDGAMGLVTVFQYEVWGQREALDQAVLSTWGFTGRRSQADVLGIEYFRARYLASDAGRWIARDALWPDHEPHPYGYVMGNPGRITDPTGLGSVQVLLFLSGQATAYLSGAIVFQELLLIFTFVGSAAIAAAGVCWLAEHGKKNIRNEHVQTAAEAMLAAGLAKTICEALQKMYDQAKDSKVRKQIRQHQKALRCVQSRQSQ
jgi:RHS repeat-associated protein